MLCTGIQKNLHLKSWVSTASGWGRGHRISSVEYARWMPSMGESRSWEEQFFPNAGGGRQGRLPGGGVWIPTWKSGGVGSSWGHCITRWVGGPVGEEVSFSKSRKHVLRQLLSASKAGLHSLTLILQSRVPKGTMEQWQLFCEG